MSLDLELLLNPFTGLPHSLRHRVRTQHRHGKVAVLLRDQGQFIGNGRILEEPRRVRERHV